MTAGRQRWIIGRAWKSRPPGPCSTALASFLPSVQFRTVVSGDLLAVTPTTAAGSQTQRPGSARHRGLWDDDAMAGLSDRSTSRRAFGFRTARSVNAASPAVAGRLRLHSLRTCNRCRGGLPVKTNPERLKLAVSPHQRFYRHPAQLVL